MLLNNLCIARAPLRIGYVGGGSDLPGGEGATVSVAIDKFVYCVAKRRYDKKIYVTWTNKEIVDSVDEIQHDIIRECLKICGVESGIEILTFSDIPGVGSGLGSSAATTVAVLCALYRLTGEEKSQHEIAETAASVEMDILGRSCGPQDPYISTFGGVRLFLYSPNGRVGVRRIDLTPHEKERLETSFYLFGPHTPKGETTFTGRNSDDILSKFSGGPSFRKKCIELCNEFVSRVNGHLWLSLGETVEKHNQLKRNYFPGYESKDLEEVGKEVKQFKLCGAGGTGFLLVPSFAYKRRIKEIENLWGPLFPYKIFNGYAEPIYTSKE